MRSKKFNNPFLAEVYGKVHYKRENCLCLTTGKVQKGKTTVNTTFAASLDPDFSADHVVWLPRDFSKMLSEGKLKRGNVVLFEEIGTEAGGIPRRKWFAFNNFVINDVLQTFGFEGLIVFFSVPSMNYIDSNALKLMDYRISVESKNLREKTNRAKIWRLDYNEDMDKIYRHKLRDKDGNKIPYYVIKRTNDMQLLKEVFSREKAYKKWIQTDGFKRIEKRFRATIPVNEDDIVKQIIADFNDGSNKFWKDFHGKRILIRGVVENEFDIGYRVLGRVKDRVYHQISLNPDLSRDL